MNNKIFATVALCVLILAVGAYAFGERRSPAHMTLTTPTNHAATQSGDRVPDHLTYNVLLHHVATFDALAKDAEARGNSKYARSLRATFKEQADLADEQANILSQIAADCMRETKEVDAKAKLILDARRAYYKGDALRKGQEPLPPSPELAALQEERNAVILRARDRLEQAFGVYEWDRFRQFVERQVAPTVTVTPAEGGQAQ